MMAECRAGVCLCQRKSPKATPRLADRFEETGDLIWGEDARVCTPWLPVPGVAVAKNGEEWVLLDAVQTIAEASQLGVPVKTDILATLFCLFGVSGSPEVDTPLDVWHQRGNGWTDIATAAVIWPHSFGVTVFIDTVYLILGRIAWLNDWSRKTRSKNGTEVETVIGRLFHKADHP